MLRRYGNSKIGRTVIVPHIILGFDQMLFKRVRAPSIYRWNFSTPFGLEP